MTLTTVIDVGNYSTKYAYQEKKEVKCGSFPSILKEYKPMEEYNNYQRVEFNGLDYFAGEGVEAFYYGQKELMYRGNTRKGHKEGQIRLVYALYNLYKETGQKQFNIILTCPYESMGIDKKYFVDRFEGKKKAFIDGEEFEFEVNRIIVAAEGLGALHFSKSPNCAIIDAGSKTLNVLYLINGNISKDDSHTVNGGTIDLEPSQLASSFAKICNNINFDYPLVTTGGKAEEMKVALEEEGYIDVSVALLKDQPSFYVNAVGLLLKYSKRFEAMFA